MSISNNFIAIKQAVSDNVTLVAVSKTKPISDIKTIYDAGQRIFGENKIQEMVAKYNKLPKDIKWHMIGHLQRNKIKYMAHFVDLIHGVDDFKKLKEINKQAKKYNRTIECLLQVKIALENSKFGLSFNETKSILSNPELESLEHIQIVGFMGMATFTSNKQQVATEFKKLHQFFEQEKNQKSKNVSLTKLSMGMSGDYDIAIKYGSTMIRVGSAIFGNRNYN